MIFTSRESEYNDSDAADAGRSSALRFTMGWTHTERHARVARYCVVLAFCSKKRKKKEHQCFVNHAGFSAKVKNEELTSRKTTRTEILLAPSPE